MLSLCVYYDLYPQDYFSSLDKPTMQTIVFYIVKSMVNCTIVAYQV